LIRLICLARASRGLSQVSIQLVISAGSQPCRRHSMFAYYFGNKRATLCFSNGGGEPRELVCAMDIPTPVRYKYALWFCRLKPTPDSRRISGNHSSPCFYQNLPRYGASSLKPVCVLYVQTRVSQPESNIHPAL